MKTIFLKIAMFCLLGAYCSTLKASTPIVDSVISWKKQSIKMNTDLNTFLTAKSYASVLAFPLIKDSIVSWKQQAKKMNTDLNTYLTALLMSVSGSPSYPVGYTAALTGTGTVNKIPIYNSANSFTNSAITQTGSYNQLDLSTIGVNINGYGGDGSLTLNSPSGAYSPAIYFKYNGGNSSGSIMGTSSSLWLRPTNNLLLSSNYVNPLATLHIDRVNDGTDIIKATSGIYTTFSSRLGLFSATANYFTFDGLGGSEFTFIGDANPTLLFNTRGIGQTLSIGGSIPTLETIRPAIYIKSPVVGVGSFATYTDVTAKLHVKSDSGQSPLRLQSTITPTSLNDGDIWYDGTHLYCRVAGVTKQLDN